MNLSQKPVRDYRLDVFKGIACILMVLVHAHTVGKTIDTPLSLALWYVGFFAPVLFFFSIGSSLIYQMQSKNLWDIVVFNLCLLLISFADVGAMSNHYLNLTQINLFGSIAISTLLAVFIYKRTGIHWYTFLLPLGVSFLLGSLNLPHTFLYGLLFGVFPWVSFILFGMYAKFQPKKSLIIACLSGVLAAVLFLALKQQILTEDATPLYLSLGFCLTHVYLKLAEMISRWRLPAELLVRIGKQTMLFYWLHLFLLYQLLGKYPAPLVWVCLVLSTAVLMEVMNRVNQLVKPIMHQNWTWGLLFAGVFLPLVLQLSTHHKYLWLNLILFVFALNYRLIPFGQPKVHQNVQLP